MSATRLSFAVLPFLVACASGSVKVPGDEGAVDDGTTDDGDQFETTDDQEDDGVEDEEDPEPEPSIADWEGDWVGTISIEPFGDDLFEGCSGDMELDVDLDGEVDGDGFCAYGWDGADVSFEGEINELGELVGSLIIDFTYAGETPADLTASADGEEALIGEFEGTYMYSSWGEEESYDMEGSISLERD